MGFLFLSLSIWILQTICLEIDLSYIQVLLGYNSGKTTEIYTHITHKGWEKIQSPLDTLDI